MTAGLLRSVAKPAPWQDWIETDNRFRTRSLQLGESRSQEAPPRPLSVVQYIGALYCGGAERQLCNLALGLKERGHRVQVRTTYSLDGDLGHYCGMLSAGGLEARQAKAPRVLPWRRQLDRQRLAAVPVAILDYVYRLTAELAADLPDALHCWLDLANVVGGLAGLLAGVPRIVLGLRTSNPLHFPRFHHDFMLPCYRWLIQSRRVALLANSQSAAASYAEWLDYPASRIAVVANGVAAHQFTPASAARRQAARRALGLTEADRVVCGIFRLFEEKQPELFLRVVRQAAARVPGLRVLIAGVGPLEGAMRAYLAEHGMDHVQLLGRREDITPVLVASDLLLLTSALDSSPNAVIEAQYLSLPVVATDTGGIGEIVGHGQTGLLAGIHDADRLTDHVVTLLNDAEMRARFSLAARSRAESLFNLEQMIRQTLDVYTCQDQLNPAWSRTAC